MKDIENSMTLQQKLEKFAEFFKKDNTTCFEIYFEILDKNLKVRFLKTNEGFKDFKILSNEDITTMFAMLDKDYLTKEKKKEFLNYLNNI